MGSRINLDDDEDAPKKDYQGKHYIIVTCETEKEQRELLETLLDEGYRCRALTS